MGPKLPVSVTGQGCGHAFSCPPLFSQEFVFDRDQRQKVEILDTLLMHHFLVYSVEASTQHSTVELVGENPGHPWNAIQTM